jgi:hypothetical protein
LGHDARRGFLDITAEPDLLILLLQVDLAQVVFFHQLDQLADAVEAEYIARARLRARHGYHSEGRLG